MFSQTLLSYLHPCRPLRVFIALNSRHRLLDTSSGIKTRQQIKMTSEPEELTSSSGVR